MLPQMALIAALSAFASRAADAQVETPTRPDPQADARLDAPPTMRLRLTFGGGAPRVWTGWAELSDGQFRQPQLLGLEPDEPGSMGVGVRVIQIGQPSPRSYDGLDVDVHAPLDALLRIRLAAADPPGEQRNFEFRLADLVDGVHPASEGGANLLDAKGNRLVLSRAPGDRLRVAYDRDGLIFAPKEVFRFTVAPHLLNIPPGEHVQFKARIVSRLSGREYYSRQQDARVRDDGGIDAWGPHEFALPDRDDVYELIVTVAKPGLLDPLVPANRLTTTRPLLERRLQFVGLMKAPDDSGFDPAGYHPPAEQPAERLVDEFDPINPNWSERVARWPVLKRIPRMKQGKLGHGKSGVVRHQDRQWMSLAPDAWQAHPLSIDAPGEPHILEVEYPDDVPQTLGISLIEPNGMGKISPLGVDTAVQVEPPAVGAEPAVGRHRLLFWPKTKTPIVLLTSHDPSRAAVYRRVRVFRLSGPPAPRPALASARDERLVGAWLDKPLFPEMFGAGDTADRATARSLDDWRTFYEGGDRFVQHLRYAGYNSAVVPALCEGSALYPSKLLKSTAKYDTGVYLSGGHDPQRKDVLELLFRLFDREGLTLLPALQFNTPLPELERQRGGDRARWVGMELVNRQGRTWLQRNQPQGGLAPYYNPLDPRVQTAMTEVVRELVGRYGHHPSFGGVVLQLSPRGYAMLPGADWGFDDRTFTRFAADRHVEDPGAGADRFAERARWCGGEGKSAWLDWRAEQMTALYKGMSEEVRGGSRGARLFLAGAEMLDGESLRRVLRPTVSGQFATGQQVRAALLELGLDPQRLAQQSALTLVAPQPEIQRAGPSRSNDWDREAIDQLHARLGARGSLLFRPPATRRLQSFDAASPFGAENTYTWLAAQVSPAGDANRRRFARCLARGDRTVVFDGGWMLPRGQEEALADTLAVLRHLPGRKLASTVQTPLTKPVILRTEEFKDHTTAYLVNESPWPVEARVNVQAQPLWRVEPLVPGADAGVRETKVTWTVKLPPFGIVAGVIDQADVDLRVAEVRLPEQLRPQLLAKLQDVHNRALALKQPRPSRSLVNLGFEEPPDADGNIFGWVHARGDGVQVSLANGGNDGSPRALKVVSRSPEVWVRSQPFPAPRTGRIAVWARLRTPNKNAQPPLRLAIEARRGRRPYYRFANVGAGVPAAPLSGRWAPFVLQIDDLPREGLDEFRIGFDLMGPGEVWIDDVVIYDLSFTKNEQIQIDKQIAEADYHLREDNLAEAAEMLDDYWPRFLLEHVEPLKPIIPQPPAAPPAAPPNPPPRQSFLEKVRDYLPF